MGLGAAAGLISGWLTPRGPLTTVEALVSMPLAIAVGVAAGIALGRRWAALVAPAAFIVVLEITRIGLVGPTVDAIQIDSIAGALALVAGRGIHGLLVLLPMAVGALYGAEVAARRGLSGRRPLRWLGWLGTGLLTLVVVLIAALLVRPASTAPILGPDGLPRSGSIAELTTVPIGGHDQVLMIRGASVDNPVLLHLAGGPGGTDIGAMRLDAGLEQRFVVVTWDQRGTGKSYPALDPTSTLTLDQVVSDTVEVTRYLRERFGQDRIYLSGQSWGTLPATLAAHRAPEMFSALITTGQMVDPLQTDQMFYDDTLAWAQSTGNTGLEQTLSEVGPPPYANPLTYATVAFYERDLNPYPEFDGRSEMTSTIFTPENSLLDSVNAARGLADTFAVLYPQLQDLDLRSEVPALEVPVYVVMGEHEAPGRVVPAQGWFDELAAPTKEWVQLPASSHRASFEQPAAYNALMDRVLEETTDN